MPSLDGLAESGNPSRIAYDYLASVIEFMEQAWRGAVSTGALMERVRDQGVNAGLRKVLGVSVSELEARWHADLRERMQREPECRF